MYVYKLFGYYCCQYSVDFSISDCALDWLEIYCIFTNYPHRLRFSWPQLNSCYFSVQYVRCYDRCGRSFSFMCVSLTRRWWVCVFWMLKIHCRLSKMIAFFSWLSMPHQLNRFGRLLFIRSWMKMVGFWDHLESCCFNCCHQCFVL